MSGDWCKPRFRPAGDAPQQQLPPITATSRVALGSLLFKLVGSLIILPFVHLLAETMGKLPLPKKRNW
ncbi:hypothetical protein O5282_05585 [Escherichia coli]|nr:hypothetical protein [Escherichia coli]